MREFLDLPYLKDAVFDKRLNNIWRCLKYYLRRVLFINV